MWAPFQCNWLRKAGKSLLYFTLGKKTLLIGSLKKKINKPLSQKFIFWFPLLSDFECSFDSQMYNCVFFRGGRIFYTLASKTSLMYVKTICTYMYRDMLCTYALFRYILPLIILLKKFKSVYDTEVITWVSTENRNKYWPKRETGSPGH